VVTISRESYSWDVDRELNRALDWLKSAGIRRVILSGDFHLSTQMVGADTSEFFSALTELKDGLAITNGWSATARRFHDQFEVSVAFVSGKRCMGGMLELVMHCHHIVSVEDARFGWPEVTLPVVPGMEGCHWPYRRTMRNHWPRITAMLLGGEPVPAKDAVGWLIDVAAPLDKAIATAWAIANGRLGGGTAAARQCARSTSASDTAGLPEATAPPPSTRVQAIAACITQSCGVALPEALPLQARIVMREFLASPASAAKGRVGAEAARVMGA
jgi:enoyl-CoA hydratase/carnithine racemase